MALSLPCKLGNILGSGCRFGRQFLANTAETIQHQLHKTVKNFLDLCIKYSRETNREKGIKVADATAADEHVVDTNQFEVPIPNPSNTELLYLLHLMMFFMASFSPQSSLSEYTIDLALNKHEQICSGIKVYHAGVAGKLGCLRLKSGLLCMLRNFATIYTLAECISDLVLSKFEIFSGIIVHHAGVAAKVTFYLLKSLVLFKTILFCFEMPVTECKMINFVCAAEPMKRFSQQSCAPRRSGSQAVHQVDDQCEGQCDAEEQGGGHEGAELKLLFVVGVLQLLSSPIQFDFCTCRIFHWKCT